MQCYTKKLNPLPDNYIYQNYHKHSVYTNVMFLDSVAYVEDYAKRAVELGHGIISSCEHGYQGRYIESFEMAQQYNLKFLFCVESYFVKNRFDKDKTNAHLIIAAKNENGRKAINRILSEASLTGFYFRPRIDLDLLLSLPKDDVWVTTACLGGINKYEDYENLVITLHNYFKDNFYLEVQAHYTEPQKILNKQILHLSKKHQIEIIAGVDSHYIFPEDAWMRTYLQKSGKIFLESEEGWFMDYPSGQELYKRFKEQGVLDDDDIACAMNNTNIFLSVEEYNSDIFTHDMTMPSALKYKDLTEEEKNKKLLEIVNEAWQKEKINIPTELHSHYVKEIYNELKTIFEIHHADYFLLNYEIIKNAVDNKGGMITFSGRGCQVGGALIPTNTTLKLIEDIQVGEQVISSDGKFHTVLQTFKYDIDEPLVQVVHEYGINRDNPTIFTQDHKILIHRNNQNYWIEAQNILPTDYVCCPKIKNAYYIQCPIDLFNDNTEYNNILQDENFWYFKVKEIKKLPKQSVSVYDFTVEGMHDYLSNNMIVHNSGPSFYVNHLLGFTAIDRINCPITLYPERFLSASRIKAGSLADIDFNCGNTSVFEESQREILGDGHSYPMIAYGTLKPKAAWKMYCRSTDVSFDIANQISEKIDEYEKDLKYWTEDSGEPQPDVLDYIPDELQEHFLQSKKFLGLIASASRHPCFVGNTLVNTENGYKQIKDIQIGEKVLSHDGRYHEVLATMVNQSNDLYELKTGACEKIIGTGNHPFYVITKYKEQYINKNGNLSYRNAYTEPMWKELSTLTKNDLIGMPINTNSTIPTFDGLSHSLLKNKNFWWFVGRFVGDGWIEECNRTNRIEKRIKLCCNNQVDSEKIEIEQRISPIFNYRIEKHPTSYKFIIANTADFALFNFLKQFKKYAKYKIVPKFVIDLPNNLLKEFLDGYFSADGYLKKENHIKFTTISEQLFYSLSECVMKVYKVPVRMCIRKAQDYVIEGRTVHGNKQYIGMFCIQTNKEYLRRSFYKNGCIWINIKEKNQIQENCQVYNLTINETNTYNVYNHIVHNCAHILFPNDIKEEIGVVRLKSKGGKETIVACMDGLHAEKYLLLKNDLLTVACVKLIYLLYDRVGIPKMSLNDLLKECKRHPEVWQMYEKGYVIGLNQVEKNSTKHRVMIYKPKNISELSAFIAGIRPAFKSLIEKLVNREHFSYHIDILDKLLQTEELPESFILYQEQIMKILAFSGIPLDDCYTVIKSISKKRVKKIMHYKELFLKGMTDKLMEDGHLDNNTADRVSHQIWGIIEDASSYGFNSSHSLSVSFDSLLAAYFKALYPLEFYEVYLNLQMERSDKTKALLAKKEAKDAFNISILPMRFGQDNRKFTAYYEKNALSNCLKSIKGFGDIVGEELYKIAHNTYDNFLDILIDLNSLKISKTQIRTLIILNYFEQFGKNKKLLQIFDLFQKYMGKSQLKKSIINDNPSDWNMDIFHNCIIKECDSIYKIDFNKYIREVSNVLEDKCISLRIQFEFERDLLDIPIYINKQVPETWYYVLGFKTYNTKKNLPYLILYQIQTGKMIKCSINRGKLYDSNIFYDGSIINVLEFEDVAKRKLNNNGKWEVTNELKTVIKNYEVIDNYNRNREKNKSK